jgi:hypothetical protein
MRARIRQMVRDFPYFNRAINVLVNFTVGTGTNSRFFVFAMYCCSY